MPDNHVIDVAVCAHNEEETVGELIEQVMDEEIPLNEIIVAAAGDDDTKKIVRQKEEQYEEVRLIEEDEREGQIVAQNKILENAEAENILFLDGDGLIEKRSLEKLYQSFDIDNIVSGKEVPLTEDSFLGEVIDIYGKLHHEMCLRQPRFSTHIGLIPRNLVDSFPEIVLDDAFVENNAIRNDYSIDYVENAVKYHSTPNQILFFFHQQKKNWAGRFQVEDLGYIHTKSEKEMLKVFSRELILSPRKALPLIALGILELAAYSAAKYHHLTGKFPVKWFRPQN